MKIVAKRLAAVLLVVLAVPFTANHSAAQQDAATAPAREFTQVFDVANMTCALCPITVKKAIGRVAGVKSVTADLDARTATVVFDPAVASTDDIAAAARDAGYPATPVASGG